MYLFLRIKLTQIYIYPYISYILILNENAIRLYAIFFCAAVRTILANAFSYLNFTRGRPRSGYVLLFSFHFESKSARNLVHTS